MRDLSPDDRPREKLLQHGASALGDNELVALVLGHGTRRRNALAIANQLLATHGGLHGLLRCSLDELSRVPGIGRARAAQILAAVEVGRRTLARSPGTSPRLSTPGAAAAYLIPRFGACPQEQFGVVLLDSKHHVMRTALVASGTSNSTIVEPRDVFREATRGGAVAIVVFHNHPSGDPIPSPEDVELTRRLCAAGRLMGIEVLDHLVLGDAQYTSAKELGYL